VRTVDVARRAGCSIQQVRKLEAAGVLPPPPRAPPPATASTTSATPPACSSISSWRRPSARFQARLLLRDAHRDESAMLARLDAAHARLHQERRELELARQALRSIRNEPMADIQPADSMSVGELALALGVRPSALRHWEAEKLLSPRRNGTGLAATVRLMSATLASSTSYVRRATGSHHCGICCPHFAVNTTGMSCSPTAITASKPGPGRCWAAPQPLPHSWGTAAEHLNLEPACPRAIRPGGSVRWCRVRLPTRPGN